MTSTVEASATHPITCAPRPVSKILATNTSRSGTMRHQFGARLASIAPAIWPAIGRGRGLSAPRSRAALRVAGDQLYMHPGASTMSTHGWSVRPSRTARCGGLVPRRGQICSWHEAGCTALDIERWRCTPQPRPDAGRAAPQHHRGRGRARDAAQPETRPSPSRRRPRQSVGEPHALHGPVSRLAPPSFSRAAMAQCAHTPARGLALACSRAVITDDLRVGPRNLLMQNRLACIVGATLIATWLRVSDCSLRLPRHRFQQCLHATANSPNRFSLSYNPSNSAAAVEPTTSRPQRRQTQFEPRRTLRTELITSPPRIRLRLLRGQHVPPCA